MSKFVRKSKFEMTFDGDQVRALLAPLRFSDALAFNAAIGTKEKPGTVGDLFAEFKRALPEYVTEFGGLRAADGTEVSFAEVIDSVYFMDIVKGIGFALMDAARVADPRAPSARPNGAFEGVTPLKVTPLASEGSDSVSG